MPVPSHSPSVRRVAEISLDAVRDNLRSLAGEGGAEAVVADLRADAYGHGLELVVPALVAAGVRALLVSHRDLATARALVPPHVSVEVAPFGREPESGAPDASGADGANPLGPELFGLTDRALRPALRLVAEVLALKPLRAGEGVSYGYTYRPERDTTLALIGIGYAHGAVRRASNRAPVFVGGATRLVRGAISMDQFSVDLEGAHAAVGDEAVLFGEPARGEPHVLDWADATGIPAAAITARIAPTVERIAVDGDVAAATTGAITIPVYAKVGAQAPTSANGAADAPRHAGTRALDGAVARVSLDALRHNVARLASTVAPAATMLVVKSDAYGHDLLPCVHAGLEAGATSLGALEIGAGLALRDAGVTVPLFAWMHGARADFRSAIEGGPDLGVSAAWQLEAIAAAGERAECGLARVHLKIDTGLHRSGSNREDWPALVSRAVELERAGRLRIAAAWSHLSDTSPEEDRRSLARFDDAVAEARSLGADFELLHVGASSAGIDYPEARFDLVRFGIAAFGISPFHDRSGRDLGLEPVMTLAAPVVAVAPDGATARIALGFGDGLQCVAGAERAVLLGGHRCPIVAVGPDASTIDVTALRASGATLAVGDEAIAFGAGHEGEPTAEEWAAWSDTVGDELVTGVTTRVPRVPARR